MFLSAAIFNWGVAALFILAPGLSLGLLGITVPDNPIWLHFFGVLVGGFGIGYFLTHRNPSRNRDLIMTGAIAKLLLVLLGCIEVMIGNIAVTILLPLSVDLLYGVLFLRALSSSAALR